MIGIRRADIFAAAAVAERRIIATSAFAFKRRTAIAGILAFLAAAFAALLIFYRAFSGIIAGRAARADVLINGANAAAAVVGANKTG